MILKCDAITKCFGNLKAIDNLSFTVNQGEVFGIAGPNGSGKTTLFNVITGIYPFSGKIEFEGRAIHGLRTHKICHRGIARTFQIPQLALSLSVYDNIRAAANFGADLGKRKANAVIKEVIDFVELGDRLQVTGSNLKLLDKKLTMIAAALATRPRLLLLDEPIAGLNPGEIRKSIELFKRINSQLGVTIIIIEHFMKVLTELSKRMMVLENGRLICSGAPAEVMSDPRVIECYLGDEYA